ncbi:hypothetical protein SK128_012016 [Halocaridina rubra]|uniref:Ubiquitin carboxyl-terminal hydrolase MINDY n=1 Tax=Halocaridina rubra TaxID=373956 RepID=A0AAN8X2U6_HALRR
MPKLYWRNREEEVVSGRPSRLGFDSPPRPGTQESVIHSPSHSHLFWLHSTGNPGVTEDGVGRGDERSPPIMKINTQVPNFKPGGIFDNALDSFRPHASSYEMKNGFQGPIKAHANGHVHNGLSNGFSNGHSLSSISIQNGLISNGIQGRKGNSVFDTDADVDIATMAAQRDQLRGARNNRGMMAPVMSKTEESSLRSATRRLQMAKQRSESGLGGHELGEVIEEHIFPTHVSRDMESVGVPDTATRRRRFISDRRNQVGGILEGLEGVSLRSPGDYLIDADRRNDIMAQSMRRQSLRSSKQSLMEGGYGNYDSATSSRLSVDSTNEFAIFRGEEEESNTERREKSSVPKFIPNSHEDIQILNLQGFMDSSSVAEDGASTSRRKQRKRKGKRESEDGTIDRVKNASSKFGPKSRRKRTHRSSKGISSDDDGEMVLKDIDELDSKVAGLVLGPKPVKESVGKPITLEEAGDLKNLLMGSPAQSMSNEWMMQNFQQNANANLSYGLVQKKGGPCGVLACVQAYMMKCLIFGSAVAPSTSPVSPLRPSQREWSWALSAAITEILWKAGQEQKAVLALPGSFPHFSDQGVGRYSRDGVTETITLHEYVEVLQLYDAVSSHLTIFTNESGSGCVILLYSALLSRGIESVKADMDAGGGHLINAHGYSSQEIVNLMLTGRATTNTFDGEQTLGSSPTQMLVLHGVQHRSEIGFLSLYEHYDCYKVGSFLKSPDYPIWVVCCESHFSLIFSRDTLVTADSPSVSKFDIYYYDGLAVQDDEIRLTIDLEGEEPDVTVVPPLEHCIRTKWHRASVEWNGIDPLL